MTGDNRASRNEAWPAGQDVVGLTVCEFRTSARMSQDIGKAARSSAWPDVGRAHSGTRVVLLINDLDIRVVNIATGELLRALRLDPSRDYQGRGT